MSEQNENQFMFTDRSGDDSHACVMNDCVTPAHFEILVNGVESGPREPEMMCGLHISQLVYEIIQQTEAGAGWAKS